MRHGTNGFTSLLKEGVLKIFFALKNPTASAGFEPVNLGTKDPYLSNDAYGVAPKLTLWYQYRPIYKTYSVLTLAECQVYTIYLPLMQPLSKFWSSADHYGLSLQHQRVKHRNNFRHLVCKMQWNTLFTCGRKLVPTC